MEKELEGLARMKCEDETLEGRNNIDEDKGGNGEERKDRGIDVKVSEKERQGTVGEKYRSDARGGERPSRHEC